MARRRPITLVLAVLALIQAGRFVNSEPWFGFGWFVLGVLLLGQYSSERVRTFIDRHRIALGTGFALIFAVVGYYFFKIERIDLAIATVLCLLLLLVLLALDLYSIRYVDV